MNMALAKYSTVASGQTMAQTWLGLSEQLGLHGLNQEMFLLLGLLLAHS